MVPDWKALLPHRPLDPDSEQYVPPPAAGGERIAEWILADRTTVLVAGPVGIGKSTELARAAKLLQADRLACLVRLDRFENMKRVTVDQILLRIAGQLVTTAIVEHDLPISTALCNALTRAGTLDRIVAAGSRRVREAQHDWRNDTVALPVDDFGGTGSSLLKLALAEVSGLVNQRIALLLDGLEKMLEGAAVTGVFDALGELSEDVDLVVVLPWFQAFGVGTETILRPGEHLVSLRAGDVQGSLETPPDRFLGDLLARRLGDGVQPPSHWDALYSRASYLSGGVPRTFLQLVADAGTYARMRRKADWPDFEDLRDAITDQREAFRRILRRGDTDAIVAVRGSDGRELDLDRKVRLLAHGVLLERLSGSIPVLTVHPLVAQILLQGSHA